MPACRLPRLSSCSAIAVCLLAAPATATSPDPEAPQASPIASASAAPTVPDEIVVTARLRREDLQSVPLAVSAFSEAAIDAVVPETIVDFQKRLPNVQMSDVNFSGNTLAVSIRGISFADLEKTFENAIGVAIDGVYLGTNTGAAFEINDVESIEILRGPQGTLQGRNAIGGAVIIRRTRPTGEPGAKLNLRYGSYDNVDVTAVVNTPRLGDMLALKFFGTWKDGRSHTINQVTGRRDGGKDYLSFGVAGLIGRPEGDWSALVTVDHMRDRSEFAPPVNLTVGNLDIPALIAAGRLPPPQFVPAPLRPFVPIGAGGTICDSTRYAFGSNAGCASESLDRARAAGFDISFGAIPFRNFMDATSATLEINGKVGDASVTAISGYRWSKELLLEENTGAPPVITPAGPLPVFVAARDQRFRQFSQELRFNADLGPLDLVAGVYYLWTRYRLTPGRFNGVTGQAFLFGAPVQNFTAGQTLNSYAAFAEGIWTLAPDLRLTTGFRYTRDEKAFDIDTTAQANGRFAFTGKRAWEKPTWRVILDWKPVPDLLLFGSYSRGFRAGGWNGRAASLSAASTSYDPETVDSYELGFKLTTFDARLRFNASVFQADYKNVQQDIIRASPPPAVGTETIVENAAQARIRGAEFEASFQVTDGVTLRGALGLLDAKYRRFLIPDLTRPGQFIDVTAQRQWRRAPDVTASAGIGGAVPVDADTDLLFDANLSYVDRYATSPVRDRLGREIIDSQTRADFSVGVLHRASSGQRFRLTGYVKDAFRGGGRLNTTLDAGLFFFGVTVPARTFGVEAAMEF